MIDFENGKFAKLRRVDDDDLGSTVKSLLLPDETVIGVYKTVRDRVVFTDRRVMALNIQGTLGKKQSVTTLPYRTVVAFSIETSGVVDTDSELEIFFSSVGRVTFEFLGSRHIAEIGRTLSEYVL